MRESTCSSAEAAYILLYYTYLLLHGVVCTRVFFREGSDRLTDVIYYNTIYRISDVYDFTGLRDERTILIFKTFVAVSHWFLLGDSTRQHVAITVIARGCNKHRTALL